VSEQTKTLWILANKALLLGLVITVTYVQGEAVTPWHLLVILLYVCFNMAIAICKSSSIHQALHYIALGTLLTAAFRVDLAFFLLLPPLIHGLASRWIRRHGVCLVLMLLPLVLVPEALLTEYIMSALFSFLLGVLVMNSTESMAKYENMVERLRSELFLANRRLAENDEYLKQSEYTYKLEERNRLSQEIHDKIGHSIAGALIQMEASKRLLETDKVRARELLQNAISISKEGIDEIRHVLKNMKPPPEQLGIHRMQLFLEAFSSHNPLRTSLIYRGNIDLIQPIHWKIIQDNTREALTNALKYSDATAVTVDIRGLGAMIRVEVADNGSGASKIVKGLGIQGMEERMAALQGKLLVDGTKGFSVTMLFPILDKSE
jgi:signal transduction histidine kinase